MFNRAWVFWHCPPCCLPSALTSAALPLVQQFVLRPNSKSLHSLSHYTSLHSLKEAISHALKRLEVISLTKMILKKTSPRAPSSTGGTLGCALGLLSHSGSWTLFRITLAGALALESHALPWCLLSLSSCSVPPLIVTMYYKIPAPLFRSTKLLWQW